MNKKRIIAVGIAAVLLIAAIAAVCFLRKSPDITDDPAESNEPTASTPDVSININSAVETPEPEPEPTEETESYASAKDYQIMGGVDTTVSSGVELSISEDPSLLMSAWSIVESKVKGLSQDGGLSQTAADELGEKEYDANFQTERDGMRMYVIVSTGADFKGEIDKLDISGCTKCGYWLQTVNGKINACLVVG